MNLKKMLKSAAAVGCAAAVLMSDTLPIFATTYYEYDENGNKASIDDSAYVVAMTQTAPMVIDSIQKNAADIDYVTYEEVTEQEKIDFNTIERKNKNLEIGKTVTVTEGKCGVKINTMKVKMVGGNEVSRELISETIETKPIDKVIEYGTKKISVVAQNANAKKVNAKPSQPFQPATSGAPTSYTCVYECTATAYDLSPEENGGYGGQTAMGVPLDRGIIAVDPRVIPLGKHVYVEALDGSWSYGYALAADTGGAIKGNRVDLCYRTKGECIQFGRRKCRVYVLD